MSIKGFRAINIQTWLHEYIEFSETGLTVFEAPSETGKSVWIKCLKIGINYNDYRPKVRRSIVRNWWNWKSEKDNGIFIVYTGNNEEVTFIFTPNGMETYIKYSDNSTKYIPGQGGEEVIKLLGFSKCHGDSRIINILDNESPIPFDTTGGDNDNSLLELFIKDTDLETRRDNSSVLMTTINKKLREKTFSLSMVETDLLKIPHFNNLDLVKCFIDEAELLEKRINSYSILINLLDNLKEFTCKKVISKNYINEMNSKIENLSVKEKLLNILNKLLERSEYHSLEKNVLSKFISESDSVKQYSALLNLLFEIKNNTRKNKYVRIEIKSLEKLQKTLEINSTILDEILYLIHNIILLKSLKYLKDEALELFKERLKKEKVTVEVLKNILEIRSNVKLKNNLNIIETEKVKSLSRINIDKELIVSLSDIKDCLFNLKNAKIERDTANKEYKNFISENPVCPLCHNELREEII